VRVTPGRLTTLQIELANVSARPVDAMAKLEVVVDRLPGTPGPDYSSTIDTTVDPTNGHYLTVGPGKELPRLTLAAGEARTVMVDLAECKWSYRYIGNRTPDSLRDVAQSGSYRLLARLVIIDGETMPSSSRPVRIRIVV
jgi:hypothetical protein